APDLSRHTPPEAQRRLDTSPRPHPSDPPASPTRSGAGGGGMNTGPAVGCRNFGHLVVSVTSIGVSMRPGARALAVSRTAKLLWSSRYRPARLWRTVPSRLPARTWMKLRDDVLVALFGRS